MMRVRLEVAFATHQGFHRAQNQDRTGIAGSLMPDADGSAMFEIRLDAEPLSFVVCDGMGGYAGGETAARITAQSGQTGLRNWFEGAEPREIMGQISRQLQAYADQHPDVSRFGTTLAGICFGRQADGEFEARWLNVGDTRIYRLRGSQLRQISLDHVAAPGSSRLTRCLRAGPDAVIPEPWIGIDPLKPATTYLLATDGLTSLVSHDEICAVMTASLTTAAPVLRDRALEQGGTDNISILIISVRDVPEGVN